VTRRHYWSRSVASRETSSADVRPPRGASPRTHYTSGAARGSSVAEGAAAETACCVDRPAARAITAGTYTLDYTLCHFLCCC